MEQMNAVDILAACDKRREERRAMLRAMGTAGVAVAGAGLLAACDDNNRPVTPVPTPTPAPPPAPSPTPTPTPTSAAAPTEGDALNFALNLEYLEAQFYSFAAFGTGLAANLTGGGGTGATATVGGRRVNFSDQTVAAYAREIARDEIAHVAFLRTALGNAAVPMPAINISGDPSGAFSVAARAAGLINAGQGFDPYFSDENFLLAAFLFEDVGVTAYKGAIRFISRANVEAAAGIHAVEAYHAGLIRTVLWRRGLDMSSLITQANAISAARNNLDGASETDQGISSLNPNTPQERSNIAPTDASSIAFTRTPQQVLNVLYLTRAAATAGGFFPAGVNGNLRTSGAN